MNLFVDPHVLDFHDVHLVEIAVTFAIPFIDERSIQELFRLNHVGIQLSAFQGQTCLFVGDVSIRCNLRFPSGVTCGFSPVAATLSMFRPDWEPHIL